MATQSRAPRWAKHHLKPCRTAGMVWRLSHCEAVPVQPQLWSIENASDITAPKYHFHDDTAELAELLAFQHHFKMMTTVFCCWIQDGRRNFITFKPQHVLSIFILLLPHFLLLYFQSRDGANHKRRRKKITAQTWKVTDRFLLHRSLAFVLQTEKLLTHPASCHHAKGSTNSRPSGGPLKLDRRQG